MLVIYDLEGTIFLQAIGVKNPVGIPYLNIEIPAGKRLVSVDVSKEPHTPVFEDLPKSEMELLKEQVEQLQAQQDAMISGAKEGAE